MQYILVYIIYIYMYIYIYIYIYSRSVICAYADGSPVVLDWYWAADFPRLRERRLLQKLGRQEGIRPAGNQHGACPVG